MDDSVAPILRFYPVPSVTSVVQRAGLTVAR